MPILYRVPRLARRCGLPYFPVTANMLLLGPLGIVVPLPGQVQAAGARPGALRRAAGPGALLQEPGHGGGRERSAATPARDPLRHAARAAQRLVRLWPTTGSTGPHHRGRHLLGRADGPGPRGRPRSRDDPRDGHTASPSVPFERTEFVRADQTYSILSRIVRATQVDTIVHTFLVVDSTLVRPQALHEINVIGTMNLLAAAGAAGLAGPPGGGEVVDPGLRVDRAATRHLHARTRRDQRRPAPGSSAPWSRSRASCATSPRTTRRLVVTVLRFANVLGTDIVTAISKNLSHRLCPSIFGFDPLLQFVEEDDVVRALEHVTRTGSRASTTWPATDASRGARWRRSAATRLLPLPPGQPRMGDRPAGPAGHLSTSPPSSSDLLRYGRGVDTRRLASDRVRLPLHERRRGRELHPGAATCVGASGAADSVHLRARRRAVLPALPAVGPGSEG